MNKSHAVVVAGQTDPNNRNRRNFYLILIFLGVIALLASLLFIHMIYRTLKSGCLIFVIFSISIYLISSIYFRNENENFQNIQ